MSNFLSAVTDLFARATPGRASRGLYHGKGIMFGCQVSHSMRHTRRTWKPNVQSKRLWSDILNRFIHFNVTTNVLRTIDKKGGLDSYLLKTDDAVLGNPIASMFKRKMQKLILSGEAMHPDQLNRTLSKKATAVTTTAVPPEATTTSNTPAQ
eukprot:c17454_g1_i1.p1 GENE.c17454_g1_i1~~c17454_g1_i1.p1  ORF type:complete len:152 (-),score=28.49 c17454_g1_i1:15-470(-)